MPSWASPSLVRFSYPFLMNDLFNLVLQFIQQPKRFFQIMHMEHTFCTKTSFFFLLQLNQPCNWFLTGSIYVFLAGEDVAVEDEVVVVNCIVLPHKTLNISVQDEIIL